MFVDGKRLLPICQQCLAVGVEYKPMDKLMATGSFNYYFDKNVDYDGSESLDINKIDKNFIELGLGVQYAVSDAIRVSAGYLKTITGVNDTVSERS